MSFKISIIKNTLSYYDDKSSFKNYENIAKKYNKIYNNLTKDKKFENLKGSKLKEEVKRWFFSLPLESRIKISTVENEFICKILYQMVSFLSVDDSLILFKIKELLLSNNNMSSSIQTNISSINNVETEDGIYPPNKPGVNMIKLTKEKKNKKIESQTVVFNQENLDNFSDEELINFNIGNFFLFKTEKNENTKNKNPIYILNNILFFSVHRKNYPDCMTLSPTFLLKEETFENCFRIAQPYFFYELIKPDYNNELKQYSYLLPSWINNDKYYSPIQFIFCFFEQTILIKFLLNYNNNQGKKKKKNKISIHSLINEECLESFFNNRKNVINYLNENYDMESRLNIFNGLINIEELYNLNLNDKNKKNHIKFWKHNARKFDDFNKSIRKNNNREIKFSDIEKEIKEILCSKGNILFVDYLIFQNFDNLWNIKYFVKYSIFDKLINLNIEKNYLELIEDDNGKDKKKEKGKNKKNHIKFWKKNTRNFSSFNNTIRNNTNSFSDIEKEIKEVLCSKGNIFFVDYLIFQNFDNLWNIKYFVKYSIFDKLIKLNIEKNYLELLEEDYQKDKKKEKCKNKSNKKDDEEYELYVPYFNSTDSNVHLVLNKKISNNKNSEKEIYQFIKNEIIYNIISKVLITQPDNYLEFFNEIENNNLNLLTTSKDIDTNISENDNDNTSSSTNITKKNPKIKKLHSENSSETKKYDNKIIDNQQNKKSKTPKNNISVIEKGNENLGIINITSNIDLNNNNNNKNILNNSSLEKNKVSQIFLPLKPKKDKKKKEQTFFLFNKIKKKNQKK